MFGCPVVFKRYETDKWDLHKGRRGIFIGFPQQQNGWLIYSHTDITNTNVTQDVVFDETFQTATATMPTDSQGRQPIRYSDIIPVPEDGTVWEHVENEHVGDAISTFYQPLTDDGVGIPQLDATESVNMSTILTTEEGCAELSSHKDKFPSTTFTESDYMEDQSKEIDEVLN